MAGLNLQALAKLPPAHRKAVMALHGRREWEACAEDPLYWLDATRHLDQIPYVFTKDPHKIYTCKRCLVEVVEDRRVIHNEVVHGQEQNGLQQLNQDYNLLPAIRPFSLLEYMPPIVETWITSQYYALEKSRDVMATWLFVALHVWDCMFHSGRQAIFQSEDAFKTLELVQRADLIYRETPKFLRTAIGRATFSKGNAKSGEMFFLDQKSEVLGFPMGPDQIRQFHPSSVLVDEAAFQIEAGAAFAAIKPAIMMGGRYTAISSANRSWFENICRDRSED